MATSTYSRLDFLFHPRSIALAGVTLANPDHWTRSFLKSLIEFEFAPFYLINRKGGELEGLKVYARLEEVPSKTIDYVIATVPASQAPGLVMESVAKGVKAIHFCTAGFAESGEEEGIRLEAELQRAAQKTGIRLIGPNGMGIYCPRSRMSFEDFFPKESGTVAFVSQSGGMSINMVSQAMLRRVRFSKVISYGNAADLNETDFIEHLTDDPDTRIISLYIEGVKDGNRFRRALERAAREKTVVLLKGGVTESGARAASGHTGALAGSAATWNALCRQLGIIQVSSMDELADVLVTLLFMPTPRGRRAGLIGFGGGASVLITDAFETRGLKVPGLPQDLRDKIREYTPIAGNILRNPIDISQSLDEVAKVGHTAEIVSRWDEIDFLVVYLSPSRMAPGTRRLMPDIINAVAAGSRAGSKPLAVVIEPSLVPDETAEIMSFINRAASSGLPVYYSFAGIAAALNNVLSYKEVEYGKAQPE